MLHGTLPPIHLEAVRWWNEPALSALVHRGADGEPVAPDGLVTCPLTSIVATDKTEVVTDAVLQATLAQMPEPARTPVVVADGLPPARRVVAATVTLDRATGQCELCGVALGEGEGRIDTRGARRIVRCAPSCSDRRQQQLEGFRS
jgi:hypothetical protein